MDSRRAWLKDKLTLRAPDPSGRSSSIVMDLMESRTQRSEKLTSLILRQWVRWTEASPAVRLVWILETSSVWRSPVLLLCCGSADVQLIPALEHTSTVTYVPQRHLHLLQKHDSAGVFHYSLSWDYTTYINLKTFENIHAFALRNTSAYIPHCLK